MPPLNVLICGGGIAGPALGFWLTRGGHHVTIVERHSTLRLSGAQVDLRSKGIEVVRRMGLLDEIRRHCVSEDGAAWINAEGKHMATMWANKSGKGAQGITSEYEIMRRDLVKVLFDATRNDVRYVFGKSVVHFEQDANGVTTHFSDGKTEVFDILVGADGQGSRIRKAILPPNEDPYRRLGWYIAYWMLPRNETDPNMFLQYNTTGGRAMMARCPSTTETQAYFSLMDEDPELRSLPRAPVQEQKAFFAARYKDAGWQSDRFIKGMYEADDFYCQEALQVRTDTWYKDRVVLIGDAGYCPTGGMGTTAAFVGAYVLAGEINKSGSSHDLQKAFANYDRIVRPHFNWTTPPIVKCMNPKTAWGVRMLHFVLGWIFFLRIPDLFARFSGEGKEEWFPDYYEDSGKRVV